MVKLKELNEATARLVNNHQTIAVAESVTAGLIQSTFSRAENATDFFEGGITAYNLKQKCTHLFIDATHAIECNCVSQKVAEQMALGVSRSFKSDWGIAITGYSSPVPELNIAELYAWVAISFAGSILISKMICAEKGNPDKVQEFYRDSVLEMLEELWLSKPELAHQQKN